MVYVSQYVTDSHYKLTGKALFGFLAEDAFLRGQDQSSGLLRNAKSYFYQKEVEKKSTLESDNKLT